MPESRKSSAEKKTGHGGRRPGAGRKPKGHCSPTAITELDLRAAQHAPVPDDIEDVAQQHAMAALAALVKIVALGAGDQARVNAANAILDRAYGRPAVDAGGTAMLPFPGLARARAAVVEQVRTEARRNARLAVDVLHRIAIGSESEGARVLASRSLLDRGLGLVGTADVPDEVRRLGKREQAVENAREAATGIFEPPPPPKSRLQ
jgi:hypothetical protein